MSAGGRGGVEVHSPAARRCVAGAERGGRVVVRGATTGGRSFSAPRGRATGESPQPRGGLNGAGGRAVELGTTGWVVVLGTAGQRYRRTATASRVTERRGRVVEPGTTTSGRSSSAPRGSPVGGPPLRRGG